MLTEIKFFDAALPAQRPFLPGVHGHAGAWAEFTGTVRALENESRIPALRYEIYRPMAKKMLTAHINELGQKHGLLAVRFWHREGLVPVGEAAVHVAVVAPHRKEAFAALAELMDLLKTDVPIWKVEAGPFAPALSGPEKIPPASDSVAGVWKLLSDRLLLLGDERVPLALARRRTLLAEVKADADQPPFDRSAADGYALIPGVVPAQYRVVGVLKAGEIAQRAPGPGEALRIFTGAAVPAPGLAVLMQEDARVEGEFISVERPLAPGENVRVRGSDARQGDVVLPAGIKLGAVELAILASVGEAHPLVNALPHVAHATTGDEIVPPETAPGSGQIRNSNQILISTLLQNCRVPAAYIHQEHWGDDSARAAARLTAEPFAKADVILISGGASVGQHDYTARLLEEAGFELAVRKVNMRPGRPLIVGFRGRQIAFGLPGNPVSHFVCFNLFVRDALQRLMNAKIPHWPLWPRFRTIPLSQPLIRAANPRPTFWPARFTMMPHSVEPLAWNNSGHLAALVGANALIFVPTKTTELPAGERVRVLVIHPFVNS